MTLGILGGGQLARMMALAAANLGVRVRAYDQEPDACAGHVCELHVGELGNTERLERFAAGCDAVTYEFENVPAATAQAVSRCAAVFPPPGALRTSQDRLEEKNLFRAMKIDTPAFAPVSSLADVDRAIDQVGLPLVLKTRCGGYDGKGQSIVRCRAEARHAAGVLGGATGSPHTDSTALRIPLIAETLVPFTSEVSALLVRARDGSSAIYPLCKNRHARGILRETHAWTDAPRNLFEQAAGAATRLATHLDYTGVLAVEFFELSGTLLANEMAPRVHNSGHWTMDGSLTGQFENHVRAVLGLPLGPTDALASPLGTPHACAMVNIIGDDSRTPPPLQALLEITGARPHLYAKEPRPGRKIGHVNIVAPTHAALAAPLERVRSILGAG